VSDLGATSTPSGSGARITGDDVQHLIAWYWSLRAVADPGHIIEVAVEADGAGNVDDVTIKFADGTLRCIQVKATVSSGNKASLDWLLDRPAPSAKTNNQAPSLLKKLHNSWILLKRPPTGIELITGKPMDADDPVLGAMNRNDSIGPALRRAESGHIATARKTIAEHLECDESEACDFADALSILVGQSESQWRGKVADAAMGAGVRSTASDISIGLGWIREWVKNTRDPRTAAQIAAEVETLGLTLEAPRTVVVIQGLEAVPADDAKHVLEWTPLFRGDSAVSRRGLVDPTGWNGRLADDLSNLRQKLHASNAQRILLRGKLRLPAWFGVGAALRTVAGFQVAMENRGELWIAEHSGAQTREAEVLNDESIGDGPTLLVVAISTNQSIDVRETLLTPDHGRFVTVAIDGGPSQSALRNGPDALAAAIAVREWVRHNARATDIDLVLMAPAPFALFLGASWDRMPPTTIYEDLTTGYEAAFSFTNRG